MVKLFHKAIFFLLGFFRRYLVNIYYACLSQFPARLRAIPGEPGHHLLSTGGLAHLHPRHSPHLPPHTLLRHQEQQGESK